MVERKCDFEPVVKFGGGRIICPQVFFDRFKKVDNCANCPKGNNWNFSAGMPGTRAWSLGDKKGDFRQVGATGVEQV